MTGWVEVALIAFGYQLAVLPGEKVQFIIAGLSTRYNPYLVVAAAGSAFAGWTALEVALGAVLKAALPGAIVDVFAGLLFCFFAVMLVRSAPADGEHAGDRLDEATGETSADGAVPTDVSGDSLGAATTDGGYPDLDVTVPLTDRQVPGWLGGYFPIFTMMAVGEIGDKTQLVTIGLATQYAAGSAIWVGEMAAIVPVSLANALLMHRFAHKIDLRLAHFLGAGLFVFFGVDTLQATVTGVSVWGTVVGAAAGVLAPAVNDLLPTSF